MSGIEYCGRPEPHLPHDWTPPDGLRWNGHVCAGEAHPNDSEATKTLHFVLAAVMETANNSDSGYDDDHIEGVAKYAVRQAFDSFAETLRDILER